MHFADKQSVPQSQITELPNRTLITQRHSRHDLSPKFSGFRYQIATIILLTEQHSHCKVQFAHGPLVPFADGPLVQLSRRLNVEISTSSDS